MGIFEWAVVLLLIYIAATGASHYKQKEAIDRIKLLDQELQTIRADLDESRSLLTTIDLDVRHLRENSLSDRDPNEVP